jgi:hypothetical protein
VIPLQLHQHGIHAPSDTILALPHQFRHRLIHLHHFRLSRCESGFHAFVISGQESALLVTLGPERQLTWAKSSRSSYSDSPTYPSMAIYRVRTSLAHQRKLCKTRSEPDLAINAMQIAGELTWFSRRYNRTANSSWLPCETLHDNQLLTTAQVHLADFSACRITKPVINFTGTVPSIDMSLPCSITCYLAH